MRSNKVVWDFLIPVLVLLGATALIAWSGFDVTVERFFYDCGWAGRELNPWRFLYKFGVVPGYVLGVSALVTFGAGFFYRKAYQYRKAALFLVLLLVLGPGLIVNTYFKDHWGRPRPSHLLMFRGPERMSYHQVWERGVSGEGRSFPSGHASIAFYLFAPYFILRNRDRCKARLFLIGGMAYGVMMGIARMSQGGHFPSDVLWSAGIVYLVGLTLSYLLRLDAGPPSEGGAAS